MNNYKQIANYYSQAFEQHGATPQGLAWDNNRNMRVRYRTMYEIIKPDLYPPSILDFGCGYGGFYNYLIKGKCLENKKHFTYYGIDINENLIKKARELYTPEYIIEDTDLSLIPGFGLIDIHSEEEWNMFNNPKICPESYDYIICNGTFTVKHNLTQEEMTNFMCSTLEKLWTKTNKGIAFNCMSKILDFERDDLYHVSFDELSMWVYDNLSNKFIIRQDYGLREFTMYVYK